MHKEKNRRTCVNGTSNNLVYHFINVLHFTMIATMVPNLKNPTKRFELMTLTNAAITRTLMTKPDQCKRCIRTTTMIRSIVLAVAAKPMHSFIHWLFVKTTHPKNIEKKKHKQPKKTLDHKYNRWCWLTMGTDALTLVILFPFSCVILVLSHWMNLMSFLHCYSCVEFNNDFFSRSAH